MAVAFRISRGNDEATEETLVNHIPKAVDSDLIQGTECHGYETRNSKVHSRDQASYLGINQQNGLCQAVERVHDGGTKATETQLNTHRDAKDWAVFSDACKGPYREFE